MQRPAEGVVGRAPAGVAVQLLAQQRHRPAGGRVAQVLRRVGQQQPQPPLVTRRQQRRPPLPAGVGQGGRVEFVGVGGDPVVDALPGHAEHVGDVGYRPPAVVLQDGQRAAVEAHVVGLVELPPQAAALSGR